MTTMANPSSTPKSPRSRTGSSTGGCDAAPASLPKKRRSVPPDAAPRRAAAYVRESTEEQGQGFSPDAQREAIRKFATENKLQLVAEYCDYHSGWKRADGRPEFQRLMADAAERRFDVVLVYHTSRFARNQVEARRYKQMLRERLAIRVVSVTQPMGEDPTDPSAFLAESIHEMFDEYYSVSLSFWTRTGLREKARQGHLVGPIPWGYRRDPESGIAVADPERAPLVVELFERYATGQESDRSLAAWLNATGARTTKDRPFGKDTVRDMLLNSTYCGYVAGMRSKDRSNKGLHEAIVSEELFDRVQEVRTWRARVVKPGPPSEEYLLRKLLHCERCGARMHGNAGSRPRVRRYLCSTRRYGNGCDQPLAKAEPLEEQLVDWLSGFQPDDALRAYVLASLRGAARRSDDTATRRRELIGQLNRLRDLYVMDDLSKSEYVLRRQAIEEELERTGPPIDPHLDKAEAILADFTRFWQVETEPAERRRLIASLFDSVWQDEGKIVAVKPREPFLRYFQAADELAQRRARKRAKRGFESGSDGTRTRDLRRDRRRKGKHDPPPEGPEEPD
jgi:DNA invertase Pin-like site-specific DNA recombinase